VSYSMLLAVVPMLLVMGGCVRHYTPEMSRTFEPITEFASTNSVDLKNGQPATQWVRMGDARIAANYNTWTDVAIQIASTELKKRGLTIVSGAPRTLTMSIESANYDVGMVELQCEISMRVKASDGYSTVYIGQNRSYMAAIPGYLIDGAMMRVVHEMFQDPRIVSFLTSQPAPAPVPVGQDAVPMNHVGE
jgi:hypothetical protein